MRSLLLREYVFEALLDVYERGSAAREEWLRRPAPGDHPCAGCEKNRPSRKWLVDNLQNFSGGFEALLRTVATHYDGWRVSMTAPADVLVDRLSAPFGVRPPLLPASEREAVLGWLKLRRLPAEQLPDAEVAAVLDGFGGAWDAVEAQFRQFMDYLTEEGRHERMWVYER